jgi:hypothetical protein
MEEFVAGGTKAGESLSLAPDEPPARAAPKASPTATGRVTGAPRTKTAGKPKTTKKPGRRDDDDDYDFDHPRPRRRAKSDGSRAVIYAALAGGLLLLVACVGVGAWMFMRAGAARDQEQVRARAVTAPAEPGQPGDNLNPVPVVPPPDRRPGRSGGNPKPIPPDDPQPPAEPVAPADAAPPPRAIPPVLAFEEPPNPFKAGTQTKLRELRAVKLPAAPAPAPANASLFRGLSTGHAQIVHSPRHQLLFVRCLAGVWVYDLKADKVVGTQTPTHGFSDMSLSPDEAALFVADFGGENTNRSPIKPSRVHRFDLAARTWEDRKTQKIAWKIETVDALRVLLLEQDQWVEVSLNRWETDGVGLRELSSTGCDYQGDIEYDPRTGRVYHGNRGTSGPRISVRTVEWDKVKSPAGVFGPAAPNGGGSVVLSQDGSRLYYGALQVSTEDLKKPLEQFPEVIFAASRDVAFGGKAYYRATTGSKLGEFGFKTMSGDARDQWNTALPVIAVSRDGLSVWAMDRDKNVARQFALEGDE